MQLKGFTALFGGSFDPPHLGHQMVCLYLLEGLAADEVWLLPAHTHPFAKPLSDFATRRELCVLAAKAFGERVCVNDVESTEGLSGKTYDTVSYLSTRYPRRRFALVIGADVLAETHRWYRWNEITMMVPIVVVGRQGCRAQGESAIELPDISSADVRRRLADGQPVEGLLPSSVASYINEHGLYR